MHPHFSLMVVSFLQHRGAIQIVEPESGRDLWRGLVPIVEMPEPDHGPPGLRNADDADEVATDFAAFIKFVAARVLAVESGTSSIPVLSIRSGGGERWAECFSATEDPYEEDSPPASRVR